MDSRELFDLFVSTMVVFLAFSINYIARGDVKMMLAYLFATITAFLFHELAHRWVARSHGVYAIYRAWYPGLLLALLLAIGTRGSFVFVAPGAVEIYMPIYIPQLEADIAIAGPMTNVAVALICLPLTLTHIPRISSYFYVIGYVNAFLAFFNILPIPPLDGFKVFRVSKVRWIITLILAIAMWLTYMFL